MKNAQILSTLVYVYLAIVVFVVLYYLYNSDIDYFTQSEEVKDKYSKIVSGNMAKITGYINDNNEIVITNKQINMDNKQRINELMNNSIAKINNMIDTYIANI